MTAQVVYPNDKPVPAFCLSSPRDWEQVDIEHTPGTLWERVADSEPSDSLRRGLEQSARGEVVDLGDFTQYVDQDALERAKAAHPAGKGRRQADDE